MNVPLVNLVIYLIVGLAGGVLGLYSRLPAGTLLGAVVAVVTFKYFIGVSWATPKAFGFICQVGLGVLIALSYAPGMFKQLGNLFLPMVVSTAILLFCGIVISFALAKLGYLDLPTAYLATNPGGMSALIPVAVDMKINSTLVASFHFFRVFLIVLTAPVIFKIIQIIQERFSGL